MRATREERGLWKWDSGQSWIHAVGNRPPRGWDVGRDLPQEESPAASPPLAFLAPCQLQSHLQRLQDKASRTAAEEEDEDSLRHERDG